MTELAPLTTVPLRVKLRVEDYLLLDGAGAFEGYGKTELLDGEVVYMNSQHRPHARAKMALYDLLRDRLRSIDSRLSVFVETSIDLLNHDTPEPDLTLTSEPNGKGLIPGDSVALVVEVSDTTLSSDLTRKAEIYARGGIAEYWVVDLEARVIHQLSRTDGVDYADRTIIPFSDTLTAQTIPDLTIDLDRLEGC